MYNEEVDEKKMDKYKDVCLVEIYKNDKKTNENPAKSTKTKLHLVVHHSGWDPKIAEIIKFENMGHLTHLKLVFFEFKDIGKLIDNLSFSKLTKLKYLKLNFGCSNLKKEHLEKVKKNLAGLRLESFYLSIPNAGLKPQDLDIIDEDFINFGKVKELGFNFLNVCDQEKSELNLTKISQIISRCKENLERLDLNFSRNKLFDVDKFQEALLAISDAKKMSLKLIFYNCQFKQKSILMICDTLLKFENLKNVLLDIRENYKEKYPSCKVISYCETLICVFRHMLAEGDDNEINRKYRVCY